MMIVKVTLAPKKLTSGLASPLIPQWSNLQGSNLFGLMKLAIQTTISMPIANRDNVDKLLERWIQISIKKVKCGI
jgi:hypothetical protein